MYLRALEKRSPNIEPSIIHNTIIQINCQIHVNILSIHHSQFSIVASVTRNSAIAVQSLKRLSHSNIKRNLFGTHKVLKSESTATGSVADIMIHNKKHRGRGSWYHSNHDINHTPSHVSDEHTITHSVARPRIGK